MPENGRFHVILLTMILAVSAAIALLLRRNACSQVAA